MPERIQLSRAKGWRKPAGVITVARPSRYGNPFRIRAFRLGGITCYEIVRDGQPWAQPITKRGTHHQAVELYYQHVLARLDDATYREWRTALHGRDLACWCPPNMPCHAELLIRWANDIAPLIPQE